MRCGAGIELCALTLVALGPCSAAEAQTPAAQGPAAAPRSEPAGRERLRELAAQRAALGRLAGLERAQRLEAIVLEYQDFAQRQAAQPLLSAEASFRAAELLRSAEEDGRAAAEFSRVRSLAPRTDFAARAALELGHLARRAGCLEAAQQLYDELARDPLASRSRQDEAGLWSARCLRDQGRIEAAARAWDALRECALDPLDRIEAWDRLADLQLDAGDLEAAAGTLARCREALCGVAFEETNLGARVRLALLRMRSLERLEIAVAERSRRAHGASES